jgi:hypothetical protein
MDAEAQPVTWVIVWDDIGLESLANLTEIDCADTMKRLQEGSALDGISRTLRMMQLRARLNSHRNPEIWVFAVDGSISKTRMEKAFGMDPDGVKQMIRDKGIKQFI